MGAPRSSGRPSRERLAFAGVVSGATGYSRNRSRSVSTAFAAPGLPRDCVTFGVGPRDPLQFRGGQQLSNLSRIATTTCGYARRIGPVLSLIHISEPTRL